jgi:hypothetical protein
MKGLLLYKYNNYECQELAELLRRIAGLGCHIVESVSMWANC